MPTQNGMHPSAANVTRRPSRVTIVFVIHLTTDSGAVCLPVKVVPGAARTRCMGALDGRLKIAVAAAPEKGRANAALIAHLAELLGLRRRDITVHRGQSSPFKLLRIENTTPEHVRSKICPDAPSSKRV